ncbi:MAG: hypothetical protein PHH36_09845 [Sideroxydans sp.]|nr:hypothetical protein [Sideroxydans sp.]
MATAKARHQGSSYGGCAHKRAPILFMALLFSACAHQPEAVAPVVEVKPVVQEQTAVDSKPQPAVTVEEPPVPLPQTPPPRKHDHNVEED